MAAAHFAFVSIMLKLPVSPCPPQWLLLFVFRALPSKMSVRFLNMVLWQAITSFTKRWTHSEDAHLPIFTTWRKGDEVLWHGWTLKMTQAALGVDCSVTTKETPTAAPASGGKWWKFQWKGRREKRGQERREGAWDGRRERQREWKGN